LVIKILFPVLGTSLQSVTVPITDCPESVFRFGTGTADILPRFFSIEDVFLLAWSEWLENLVPQSLESI
jgi:hypothetical protein